MKERDLYLQIPTSFSFYHKAGLLRFFFDKKEINYFFFLVLLEKVSKEKKIKNVLIEIPSIEDLSFTQVEDIVHLLEKIKNSGKTLYAYIEEGGIKTLLVASVCHYRYAGDWAQFSVLLPKLDQFYLGDFLRSFGIRLEVYAMGKYKSAGEIYTRNKISPYAKENFIELIQDQRKIIQDMLFRSHGLSQEQKEKLWNLFLKQSIINAKELQSLGFIHDLVDKVQFREFVQSQSNPTIPNEIQHSIQGQGDILPKETNETSMKKPTRKLMEFEQFYKVQRRKEITLFPQIRKKQLAIVVMDGIILRGDEEDEPRSNAINSKGYAKILQELRESPESAVLIYLNSPGGMSDASELLFQEIRKLSRIKPVYVLQADVSASGGYYISCGGNKVFSYRSTITGSIGVLRMRPNLKELYKKLKIQKSKLMFDKTSEIFSEAMDLTEEGKKLLENSTREIYSVFLDRVARGRGKDISYVKKFAEGRVYSATRFKEAGLIDEITTFNETIAMIKKDLKLTEKQPLFLNLYPMVKIDFREILRIRKLFSQNMFFDLKKIFFIMKTPLLISIEGLECYSKRH
ncbi:MAG: S49 family peptidase [Leptospiraceae bacterium]|nr:S49 family peptidase [Leptospiraceae bacterium]MDW7975321.1 S49 family peptidase [Leptospiraceae bacterium]